MRPIAAMDEVRPTSVLHHSAFGFARVREVEDGHVHLQWETRAENLPERVRRDSLVRVYALCTPGGFFDRALNAPDEVKELLQVDPPGALLLLLEELDGPQSRDDVRDWVVGRGLMTERSFDRWWERLLPMIAEDRRFRFDHDTLRLVEAPAANAPSRLDNPLLSPARRLDLAVAHKDELGEERFREQVLAAWRAGTPHVRDLCLAAMKDAPGDAVLGGLVGPGADAVDAVIHALRHGPWTPATVPADVRKKLVERVVSAARSNGRGHAVPPDAEGRLAAALWRWGAVEAVPALAGVAANGLGQDLVDAAFLSLPPRRSEALCVELLDEVVADDHLDDTGRGSSQARREAARWLGRRLLDQTDATPAALSARLEHDHARVARWLRSEGAGLTSGAPIDDTEDSAEGPSTVEITNEAQQGPVTLAQLPPRMDRSFLLLGQAVAKALAKHHAAGRIVRPTRDTIRLFPDGSAEILEDGDPKQSPRPPNEQPTKSNDVYAAAVLLLESLLGRTWPRNLSADRALPFLRHAVPELPASALAPLAPAVDPVAHTRMPDAVQWLLRWTSAVQAEDVRAKTDLDLRVRMKVGFDTHVGRMKILHTQTNQDALYVSSKGPLTLLVICDGISTANTGSGDLAAGITAQVVASLWEQWLPRLANNRPEDAHEFLDRALRMANQAVCEASLRLAGGRLEGRVPMGTTSVIAIGQGNRVCLAWLGDSRAFVVGPYGASMLTADANQAGERLIEWQRGLSPGWDATGFALVRYVGHFDELGHAEPLPAMHNQLVLLPGERLVICTDGITDYIADTQSEVAAVLHGHAASGDPDDCARALVDLANKGGGGDNATVIVATPVAS